jgi:hypothetical protein
MIQTATHNISPDPAHPMADAAIFQSVLFSCVSDHVRGRQIAEPDFFVDLNLDQIVAAITAGKEEYDLKPFFYAALHDVDAIRWRQEIMRDLEDRCSFANVVAFCENLRAMRARLVQAETLCYSLQKERCFLQAVDIYCDAVTGLAHDLAVANLASRGLVAFREFVNGYLASESFTLLTGQTKTLLNTLSAIHYTVGIDGLHVTVNHSAAQRDYSTEVEATFERFKQGDVKSYAFNFSNSSEMDHVEAQILALVAWLYPEVFSDLHHYCTTNQGFLDNAITTFDREIQFYVSYLEYLAPLKKAGLHFCYPGIVHESKEIYDEQGFDLALASKLSSEHVPVVCNDFRLSGGERMIAVSGPNQGGKTTFARTFGQLHYLASIGCSVPGVRAQLFLYDNLFTHFEREENLKTLRGKLQDDLVRAHQILEHATPNSIVVLNEIFTSTTLGDAILLSKKIAEKLATLDLLCLWVTFVEELASLSEQTVSMVSTVVPENPELRTYKIIRRPADGLAYAMAIAEKYRLTYTMIKERMPS